VVGVLGQGAVSGLGAISGSGARAISGTGVVTGVCSISGRGVMLVLDVPSQGDYSTGSDALVYDDRRGGLSYDRPGALVYDP
jgi:hypothetical protein